jgi:hypothetical protein
MNNYGHVVGYFTVDAGWGTTRTEGFVYDGTTFSIIEYPVTGGTTPPNAMPYGINDFGQITGMYQGVDGYYHGFVATPTVPVPGSLLLLGTGLLGLGAVGWRRRRKD